MRVEKFRLFYTEKARFKHHPLHAVFRNFRALKFCFFRLKAQKYTNNCERGQLDLFSSTNMYQNYWLAVWLTFRKALFLVSAQPILTWSATPSNVPNSPVQIELKRKWLREISYVTSNVIERLICMGYLNALYKTLSAILQLTSARYFTSQECIFSCLFSPKAYCPWT